MSKKGKSCTKQDFLLQRKLFPGIVILLSFLANHQQDFIRGSSPLACLIEKQGFSVKKGRPRPFFFLLPPEAGGIIILIVALTRI
jgi:hypothetical protein